MRETPQRLRNRRAPLPFFAQLKVPNQPGQFGVPFDPQALTSTPPLRDRRPESFGYDGWIKPVKKGTKLAAAICDVVCQPHGETVKQNHDGNKAMKAVVQRVSEARVTVAGRTVGEIAGGLCALVAVTREDTAEDVAWMAAKL